MDVAPFRFIAEKDRPDTVLDIGCGNGAYLALFKRLRAVAVLGVDGVPAAVLGDDEYLVRDLSQPLDLGRVFDLVVCTEVAERLDPRDADILLDSVTRHAGRTIIFSAADIFSAAEPGQPRRGHINCQPISHWLERFASRGWYPDLVDSLGIRALASMSRFRRTLVVLRRDGPHGGGRGHRGSGRDRCQARHLVWAADRNPSAPFETPTLSQNACIPSPNVRYRSCGPLPPGGSPTHILLAHHLI